MAIIFYKISIVQVQLILIGRALKNKPAAQTLSKVASLPLHKKPCQAFDSLHMITL